MKKLILLNGQWQGGGNIETLVGARSIEKVFLKNTEFNAVPISNNEYLEIEHDIYGYRILVEQIKAAHSIIRQANPDVIFTIGGGCDADISSLAYMNEKYDGDFSVLWFDAHGDLNSPLESSSKLLYGMPARILLGEDAGEISKVVTRKVLPCNFINIGGRDLEASEKRIINDRHLQHILPLEFSTCNKRLLGTLNKNVYIHFDLDVLDPIEFSDTPLPVPDGLRFSDAMYFLKSLAQSHNIVGMGLYEYIGNDASNSVVAQLVRFGLGI